MSGRDGHSSGDAESDETLGRSTRPQVFEFGRYQFGPTQDLSVDFRDSSYYNLV
jgi:hypothetical protein